jgi:regulator of sigma E protease
MLPQPPLWLVLIAFVCALGPLIFFHEMGHYLVARLFGIPAEIFSIGFGRELVGWTDRRGTRWKVAWLPLGGFVKFVGDMSPASNPAELESVPPELRDRVFQVRPVWQRFLVVLAGPIANFILAIIIFAAFFTILGAPATTNVVAKVKPNTPAAAAGIEQGDRILSVAGIETPTFTDLLNVVSVRPNEKVIIAVERSGSVHQIQVTLTSDQIKDSYGRTFSRGLLGVFPEAGELKPLPVFKAIPTAAEYTWRWVRTMVDGLAQIIRGRVSPKELGGPITIATVAGESISNGPLSFVSLVALLSINLGFINLLPVPVLDGGHLFFYAVEAIQRRPVSAKALDWAFRGGIAIILALMVFLTVNDLASLGLWDRLQRLIG